MAQKSLFGMSTLRISAGHQYDSHMDTQIVDINGSSTMNNIYEEFRAPFDCKVVDINQSNGNTVVFQSTDLIYTPLYPNAAVYISFRCTHMNNSTFNSFNYQKNITTFKQGEVCYKEGNKYAGNDDGIMSNGKVMGTHIHIEFAIGKYKGMESFTNSKDNFVYYMVTEFNGSEGKHMLNLKEACFIRSGTKVLKNDNDEYDYVNQYILTLEDGTKNTLWYFAENGTGSSSSGSTGDSLTEILNNGLNGVYLVAKNTPFRVRSNPVNGTELAMVPTGGEASIISFRNGFESDGYQWAQVYYKGQLGYSQLDLKDDYLIRLTDDATKIALKPIKEGFRVRASVVNGTQKDFVPVGDKARINSVNARFESDGYQWAFVSHGTVSGWSQMDTYGYYNLVRN